MIAVVQRVLSASVAVGGEIVGKIDRGMLVLVAVEKEDSSTDAAWLANRISGLRIFEDQDGKINLNCRDVGGKLLVVSNFTLAANARKGNRPSFDRAAPFELGKPLYLEFVGKLQAAGLAVETGSYGDEMQVSLVNDGPITLIVESRE